MTQCSIPATAEMVQIINGYNYHGFLLCVTMVSLPLQIDQWMSLPK